MTEPKAVSDYRRRCRWRNRTVTIVLALLAGGFVFCLTFHPSQERSPVATAHADMRNLAVALEAYYTDHNTYPVPALAQVSEMTPGIPIYAGFTPLTLTTPAAYTSSLPRDPFRQSKNDPTELGTFAYRYGVLPLTCWILASDGPDGDVDIPLVEFFRYEDLCDPDGFFSHRGGRYVLYDPSNGTESSGDIVRFGP